MLRGRLLAGDDEFLESHLGRARRQIGLGLCQATEVVERLRIDRIGLRPAAQAVGKVADLTRIGDGQGDARCVGRSDQRAVAGAGGFANQMRAWRQFGQKPAVVRRGIGDGAARVCAMKVELFLGKIQTEVDAMR